MVGRADLGWDSEPEVDQEADWRKTWNGLRVNYHLLTTGSRSETNWWKRAKHIIEEWATSDIYWETKKVKDGKIQPLPYDMVTCISADELTLLQTYIIFYSSP